MAFDSVSLQSTIKGPWTLETTTPSKSFQGSTTRNVSAWLLQSFRSQWPIYMICNEMQRKQSYFNCKEPWNLTYMCLEKGEVHLIEVYSRMRVSQRQSLGPIGMIMDGLLFPKVGEQPSSVASLLGTSRYHSFWAKGRICGQHIVAFINGGATHNAIDQGVVVCFKMKVEEFAGFEVAVVNGFSMACKQVIC